MKSYCIVIAILASLAVTSIADDTVDVKALGLTWAYPGKVFSGLIGTSS